MYLCNVRYMQREAVNVNRDLGGRYVTNSKSLSRKFIRKRLKKAHNKNKNVDAEKNWIR